ncbi:hypothetical protein Pyrde_0083 [Pyrodictium delaneyi]|uniref:Uncharacterized protein n=1 Tax=Pyrodictium delaneyi TaxID=1273541 RepID=A0A0P0N0Q1_9CREN|nr:hypothetical protein [Pyrodictium delaneyi]ALL00133.1 hypothetical protein Pyrde_0083 [Pyrodictium delaneyi]
MASRLARFLGRVLRPLELLGEIERRARCIRWEQECRFYGKNCLEYKLTCHDTKPLGRLLRGLLRRG